MNVRLCALLRSEIRVLFLFRVNVLVLLWLFFRCWTRTLTKLCHTTLPALSAERWALSTESNRSRPETRDPMLIAIAEWYGQSYCQCPVALWSSGRGQQTLFEIFMLDFCASMTFELPCLWLPVVTHTRTHTLGHTCVLVLMRSLLYVCILVFLYVFYAPGPRPSYICCLKLQADAFVQQHFLSITPVECWNFVNIWLGM